MKGERSNELVRTGLTALTNLEHRGATGAEPDTGDGAGILLQVPDRLLRDTVDFELPAAGAYAAGIAFLPTDDTVRDKVMARVEAIMVDEGLTVLGWRDLPVDPRCLGKTARDQNVELGPRCAEVELLEDLVDQDPRHRTGRELCQPHALGPGGHVG